jgi:hypothetical protein
VAGIDALGAREHVQVRRHLVGFDFDLVVLDALRLRECGMAATPTVESRNLRESTSHDVHLTVS